MAIAWFVCTYKRAPGKHPIRYCAMDDFTPLIYGDGGMWSESEVLGNYALVKVSAPESVLAQIGATQGFYRIPSVINLSDPCSVLTNQQANQIRNYLSSMGYTDSEITGSLGNNLRNRTLGEVLRFAASRRRNPRYDPLQDAIVLDGEIQTCRMIEDVDREVKG